MLLLNFKPYGAGEDAIKVVVRKSSRVGFGGARRWRNPASALGALGAAIVTSLSQ